MVVGSSPTGDAKLKEIYMKKLKCVIGLRDATEGEIKELIQKYKSQGYQVIHKTKGLPHNGVLRVYYREVL